VMTDGALGDNRPLSDLGVAQTPGEQLQHFELACREAGRVRARARAGPARQTARSPLSQTPSDYRRSRTSVQCVELIECPAQRALVVVVRERQCRSPDRPRQRQLSVAALPARSRSLTR
jgi:hypothetical protein